MSRVRSLVPLRTRWTVAKQARVLRKRSKREMVDYVVPARQEVAIRFADLISAMFQPDPYLRTKSARLRAIAQRAIENRRAREARSKSDRRRIRQRRKTWSVA